MIGQTISHYRVLEEISRGGMGIVYRALDVKLDREVALKVLPPDLVSDPERKRRFTQEAKAAARLEHPHIGMVFEIDEAEGVTFIAMELIRGEKLRDLLQRQRLDVKRSLEIATEVAEALACAHGGGIVHRDLKPANIMLTAQGRAKVIDFGLAKLVDPLGFEGSEVETALKGETDPGTVMGTVAYMSPEQARGQKLDTRSDIFTFGIVLHEMLNGQPPFRRQSGIETLSAILKEPAPRLAALGPDMPDPEASELQRIEDKCLAKDPAERYQTVNDLVVDLRALRRRLESGPVAPLPSRPRRTSWLYVGIGLLAVASILVFLFLRTRAPSGPGEPFPAASKSSVAVLYFENASGEPDLDWLRTGLTDMLVTNLSQSPSLEILSTDRLYQILRDMNRLDERIASLDVVQELAQRANTRTVVLGSFMKAGDIIRINLRIQDAASGRILTTEKVEGVGDSNIFIMVDDLSRRVETSLSGSNATGDAGPDYDLAQVTTPSLEAYRYYAEGMHLHDQLKEHDAIPLLERAISVDPGFAMALAKLSTIHDNLYHPNQAEEYARRALEHVDRLTLRERFYVEARFYLTHQATYDRAIQALEKALELNPDDATARNNLVNTYSELERCDEAIRHGEVLRSLRFRFAGTYGGLAACYCEKGQFEEGYAALQDFLRLSPESAEAHFYLGVLLTRWGRLDEALDAFRKGEALGSAGDLWYLGGVWEVFVLREDWKQAEATAMRLVASQDATMRLWGFHRLAATRLYHGESEEALAVIQQGTESYPDSDSNRASSLNNAARLLLEKGQMTRALELAQSAQKEGKDDTAEWTGLFLAGIAQARLGRWNEAERTAKVLRLKAESLPTEMEKRRYHHLVGELALARGDTRLAMEALQQAQAMLPPRGLFYSSPHVPIWFSLAQAYLAAGDESKAAEWLARVTENTSEHALWPIYYLRSLYFLGKIHENRGDMDKAREHYRRFYELWKDGDMDRERVEEAKSKLGAP